ncbi:hypothetical protein JI667_18905 [Bacillus sp. NTK074B]|uniref:hypothetical protein n=1 Tax=Bacillus sp. NTK074B TaxID=2802174 RepID=UPI001A8F52DE|nr:hypothetical protein [Bacillus sp. NTK074B]
MAGKTRKRNGSKPKRFPYIEVEGVESRYLDAALMHSCESDGALEYSLSDETKLLKKSGITTQSLKMKQYTQKELIALVSPHLLESYDYYNFLANMWENILNKTINYYFDDDYVDFTLEDWQKEIEELVKDEDMPIFAAINTLRFYKNGELKELIKPLLNEPNHVIHFYRETGIKMEEFDINWDEINEPALEEAFTLEEELEEKALGNRSPEDTLKMAAKMILSVSSHVSGLEEVEEFKEMYEVEKEQVVNLQRQVDELTATLKSRDSKIKSLSKDNRALAKSVDSQNAKLDLQQKEVGRLGGLLGEVRKEKEEIEQENSILNRKVKTLEKDTASITQKVTKELTKEFNKKSLHIQDTHEENTRFLENQIQELQRILEQERSSSNELSSQLEKTKEALNSREADLAIVESERNELFEKLNSMPVNRDNGKSRSNKEDDLLFGFDEQDIEDFVEFDNKPTRN